MTRGAVKVGVPTEIKADEYRVALTPAGVRELADAGHEVVRPERRRRGLGDRRRGLRARRAPRSCPTPTPCSREADMIVKVKEPQPRGGRAPRAAPRAVHLPAPRARPRADARADGVRRDLHRLRDRRGRARPAAAAGADERGGGQDRHAGRRLHAREAARRPRHPARRRARRGGGQRDRHRRRRGRHERGVHRDRHGGRGLRLRPQHRPPARARPRASTAAPPPASPRRWRSRSACPRSTW